MNIQNTKYPKVKKFQKKIYINLKEKNKNKKSKRKIKEKKEKTWSKFSNIRNVQFDQVSSVHPVSDYMGGSMSFTN